MLKKERIFLGLTVFILLFIAFPAQAQEKPVQLSLFTPVQLFSEDTRIAGIRFNFIYGRTASVTGLDLGLVNHTTTGLTKGVQWGLVGMVDADFVGWQDNTINIVKGNFEGLQWGLVNYAGNANGLQLGFINYAVTMKGLQIGLINIIKQGGFMPVFPIVNWSF